MENYDLFSNDAIPEVIFNKSQESTKHVGKAKFIKKSKRCHGIKGC